MDKRETIAVAGATGRVGHYVVDILKAEGYNVVAISRSNGVDVLNGASLAKALEGVACVIDVATGPSAEQDPATAFFTTAARNLHTAGAQAGVQRMVTVSIIGADRFSGGYGAAKIAHEHAMVSGPIPTRILRAAQFHEFVPVLIDWGRQGDASYVPNMRTQLIAAKTVARGLVDLATGARVVLTVESLAQPIVEIAGPREESLIDMARLLVARRGESLRVEGVSNSADPDSVVYESGALLPGPHATLAGPTFEEWLESLPV